jgi:GDPmannose 4,6-dehydratase
MLQVETPDDYVIATGEAHSVREFVERAFSGADIRIIWEGEGVDEIGRDADTGQVRVRIDPRYFRPTEVDYLLGDPARAREKLGWSPRTSLEELIRIMLKEDLLEAERDQLCQEQGYRTYSFEE